MTDGIEDIYVKLSADTTAFFGQVDSAVNGATSRLGKIGSFLQSSAVKWGTAIAAATASFASVQGIKDAIAKTQELGLSVAKLSRETGLSAEASSHLIHAFEHVGLTADDASRSIGIFAKKLKGVSDEETGVVTGGKSTAQILADIGIKATDASGNLLGLDEILGPLADRFKAMPDGLEKTGLAMQLFGRSGKDMIPLLNLGSKGLDEMAAAADRLGVTLTAKNVVDIKAFTFAQRDLTAALAGLKVDIGLVLMPILTRFFEWLVSLQPQIRGWAAAMVQAGRDISDNLLPVIKTLIADLRSLTNFLQDSQAVQASFAMALTAIVGGAHPLIIAILALATAVELYRTNMDDLSPTMAKVKAAIDPLVAGLAQLGDALLTMGNWLLQNQALLVGVIGGIGIAFLWVNPLIALLIGAGGLVYALGLVSEGTSGLQAPLSAAGRAAADMRLEFLKVVETFLKTLHTIQLISPALALLGLWKGATAAIGLALTYDEVGDAIDDVHQDIEELEAATDAYDADPLVSQLGHILNAAILAGQGLEYVQRMAYNLPGAQIGVPVAGKIWTAAEKIWAKLAPLAPTPLAGGGGGEAPGGAEAQKQVTAYTETLDELTKTLLGLWRAAGAADTEVAGFPWTLDLARRATERLGLTTDDLLDVFIRTGKGFGDFMRALAASEALDQLKKISDAVVASLSDLRNQFNALFGAPTREQAAINYQFAQLRLRRAQMVAAGATDEALASIDKEIARIETINTLRDAEADVLRAQLDLADKTLLSDAEQYTRARDLIQRMADLSAAALPVIQLYLDQAEAMQGWMDAMNAILFWAAAVPLPTAQVRSMQGGGIVPGPRGQPQLILAHAGESILPLNAGLNFSPTIAINIEQGADWVEISRRAYEAMTEALHQARQRSYLRGAPLGSGIG